MATTLNQNICFIGGGNMAQALIGGLLSRGLPTTRITVSDPVEQIRHILEEKNIQTTTDNVDAIKNADVVVLAVKPQVLATVLQPLKGLLSDKLVISIIAGAEIQTISNLIGGENKFTTQLLTSAMRLSGQYSWALYQLIRKNYSKFKSKNYFTIPLNELKDELIAYTIKDDELVYKYPEFPIFKREVINKAIKEIKEKTEIEFLSCLIESKEGRKVSVLRFEFLISEDNFTGIDSETDEFMNGDDAAFLAEFDKAVPSKKSK